MSGLPTGYTHFDTLIGGLQQADLLLIATSPPGDGIDLALSIALKITTTSRCRVGLLGLTMNRYQVTRHLLAMQAGIDQHRLLTGQITNNEWQQVRAADRKLSSSALWIGDPCDLRPAELRQRFRRLVDTHGVSLLVIDDIYHIRSGTVGPPVAQHVQEIREVGHALRGVACELGIPMIACAPLARPILCRRRETIQRAVRRLPSPGESIGRFLFLSRGELPETTHTNIFTVSMTREHSGLVSALALSNGTGHPFSHSDPIG